MQEQRSQMPPRQHHSEQLVVQHQPKHVQGPIVKRQNGGAVRGIKNICQEYRLPVSPRSDRRVHHDKGQVVQKEVVGKVSPVRRGYDQHRKQQAAFRCETRESIHGFNIFPQSGHKWGGVGPPCMEVFTKETGIVTSRSQLQPFNARSRTAHSRNSVSYSMTSNTASFLDFLFPRSVSPVSLS
jgi:hypothetical protein